MRATREGARGVTLVEVAIVLAVTALLAASAWPNWRHQLLRSRRVEATLALDAIERAQILHLAKSGRYAQRLGELSGLPLHATDNGRYRLVLVADGNDGWHAQAIAQGAQADDRDCPRIELRVQGAITQRLPGASCWLP